MDAAERTTRLGDVISALLFAMVLVAGCSLTVPKTSDRTSPSRSGKLGSLTEFRRAHKLHVVVVTFDGCRWQDIFEGPSAELASSRGGLVDMPQSAQELTPHLHELMEQSGAAIGAPGANSIIRASGPNFVSLPGYTELLGGITESDCKDNSCSGASQPTLLDELSWTNTKSPQAVAVITSWSDIQRVAAQNPERLALSTGANAGVTRDRIGASDALRGWLKKGETAGPFPGNGDFRPDFITSELGIRYLTHERPAFLFLGLGETDEYGHRNDYRGYLTALQKADATVGELWRVLAGFAAEGDSTLLMVTADHGRAANFSEHGAKHPESSNIWLVAAGTVVTARGVISTPVERRLGDVAPSIRKVFGLPALRLPSAGRPLDELGLVPAPLALASNRP